MRRRISSFVILKGSVCCSVIIFGGVWSNEYVMLPLAKNIPSPTTIACGVYSFFKARKLFPEGIKSMVSWECRPNSVAVLISSSCRTNLLLVMSKKDLIVVEIWGATLAAIAIAGRIKIKKISIRFLSSMTLFPRRKNKGVCFKHTPIFPCLQCFYWKENFSIFM